MKKPEKSRYTQTPVTYDTPYRLNDYSILSKIRSRGSSELFLARRVRDDRIVLIKKTMMPREQVNLLLEYFQNEIRTTAFLSNSAVVPIIEYGINGDSFYITTEHINGCDFSSLISSNRFDRPVGLMILTEGLQALHSAHTRGIAHCNFAPSSLQIGQSGRVYLTDFGSSQLMGKQSEYSYFSTPLFMPPEQALLVSEQTRYTEYQFSDTILIHYKSGLTPTEIRTLTERSIQWDIWSAGVQLYLVCSGAYPFYTPSYSELLKTIVYGDPPSIIHIAPDVPRPIANIIKQCLQKEPHLRPHSLDPVINVLQEYFFSLGISTFKDIIKQHLKSRADLLFFSPEYYLTHGNSRVRHSPHHMDSHATLNVPVPSAGEESSGEIQSTSPQTFRIESGWEFIEHKTFRHYPSQTNQIPEKIAQYISLPTKLPQVIFDGIQSCGSVVKAYFLKLLPVVIVLFTLAVVVIPGTIIGKKLSKKNGKQTSLSNLKKKIRQRIPTPPTDTSEKINLAFYVPVKNDDSPQAYDSGLQKKSTRSENNVSEKPDAISKLPANGSHSVPSKLKEPSHTKSTVKSEKTTAKSPVQATSRKKALPHSTAETPDIKSHQSPESSSGSLKISIDPPDAPVYLDGEKMNSVEIENGKKMAVGSYTVTARSPGFTPYSKTVQIEPDKTVILSIALKQEIKGNGQLHVFSYPWANLFIDGDLKGTSPTAVPVVLPEGSHKLVLKRDGYKPYSREITVKPGEVVRLQIELDK